ANLQLHSLLAPGADAIIYGPGIIGKTDIVETLPVPTTRANIQVRINGVAAPIFSITQFPDSFQINLQIPPSTIATTVNPALASATALVEIVNVANDAQLLRAGAIQVAPSAPAIFLKNGSANAIDSQSGKPEPFSATQPDGSPTILAVSVT